MRDVAGCFRGFSRGPPKNKPPKRDLILFCLFLELFGIVFGFGCFHSGTLTEYQKARGEAATYKTEKTQRVLRDYLCDFFGLGPAGKPRRFGLFRGTTEDGKNHHQQKKKHQTSFLGFSLRVRLYGFWFWGVTIIYA